MQENYVNVKTKNVKFPVAKDLYGLFFEEINRSGDGGLYPELIRNRSFEDSIIPKRCKSINNGEIFVSPTGWKDQFGNGEGLKRWLAKPAKTEIPAWYVRNAKMRLEHEDTLNTKREAALAVRFEEDGQIKNIGFDGIALETGKKYEFYMFAKTLEAQPVTVSLKSQEEQIYDRKVFWITESAYQKYETVFEVYEEDQKGILTIEAPEGTELFVGFISLMPQETYKNHGLRKDLMEYLEGLHAAFLRFPGGCAVEGFTKETSYRFEQTLGNVWERPSYQIPWHYRTTNGIGYHEYLQMCEDLGVAAMYVVNCGMTCQGRNTELYDEEEVEKWIQSACNAIDYAISEDPNNEWVKKRYEAGHPAPFGLKYVEIGNENMGEPYFERYPKFYKVLKKKYPEICFISNTHTELEGLPTEVVDEHFYNDTAFFVQGTDYFKSENPEPKVFLGEYAVTAGKNVADLKAAIAESAFLIGIENNQNKVALTSYAPLFANVAYKSWHPDLIEFDQKKVFGIPTYYALAMLAKNRGEYVLETELNTEMITEKRKGLPGFIADAKGVKFKNLKWNGKDADVTHILSGGVKRDGNVLETVDGKTSYMENFPGFARSLKDLHFVILEEEEAEEICYEGDLMIETPEQEVYLTLHNYHSPSLQQIDETIDNNEEWAPDTIDYCAWVIKDGVSKVSSVHWFYHDYLAPEVKLEIPYGEYFHFKIVSRDDGFDCYMNGKLIQSARYHKFANLAVTAAREDEDVIIKMTNFSEKEVALRINLDQETEQEYQVMRLHDEDANAVNTLEDPYHVRPVVLQKKDAGKQFTYRVPGNSLDILRLTLSEEHLQN